MFGLFKHRKKKDSFHNFRNGDLIIHVEDDIVWICGTKVGLKRLSDLILELIARPKQGHIHLEDYPLLTKNSLTGAIAIFEDSSQLPNGK